MYLSSYFWFISYFLFILLFYYFRFYIYLFFFYRISFRSNIYYFKRLFSSDISFILSSISFMYFLFYKLYSKLFLLNCSDAFFNAIYNYSILRSFLLVSSRLFFFIPFSLYFIFFLFIFYKHTLMLFILPYGFTLSDDNTLLFKYYTILLIYWLSSFNFYILILYFFYNACGNFCLQAYSKAPIDRFSKNSYKGPAIYWIKFELSTFLTYGFNGKLYILFKFFGIDWK